MQMLFGIIAPSMKKKNYLEKIQIEAAMIVTGATRSCSNAKILEEAGWESLESRRYKHRLITFYKMVNNKVPEYLRIHLFHLAFSKLANAIWDHKEIFIYLGLGQRGNHT